MSITRSDIVVPEPTAVPELESNAYAKLARDIFGLLSLVVAYNLAYYFDEHHLDIREFEVEGHTHRRTVMRSRCTPENSRRKLRPESRMSELTVYLVIDEDLTAGANVAQRVLIERDGDVIDVLDNEYVIYVEDRPYDSTPMFTEDQEQLALYLTISLMQILRLQEHRALSEV